MPLRDHFHPPFSKVRSWEEVHGGWPMVIVQHLGKTLPQSTRPVRVSISDRKWRSTSQRSRRHPNPRGNRIRSPITAVLPLPFGPAEPTLAVETDLSDFDEYEVRVYELATAGLGGRDRTHQPVQQRPPGTSQPIHVEMRHAAAAGRVARAGGRGDRAERQSVRRFAGSDWPVGPFVGRAAPGDLRRRLPLAERGRGGWLETWYHELKPGLPLPCLPLWLTEDLAIPLDLEASYEQTCRDLRIV